jgi:uncharacterized membrane protein YozB (DUF420 family)
MQLATLTVRADRLGIIASGACAVHCILTPVILSMLPMWAHYLPSDEWVHRPLAVAIAAIGGIAIIRGYRRHNKRRVILLASIGLSIIFFTAYWGDVLPTHSAEIAISIMGSTFMIASHAINHTFCRHCKLCDGDGCLESSDVSERSESL